MPVVKNDSEFRIVVRGRTLEPGEELKIGSDEDASSDVVSDAPARAKRARGGKRVEVNDAPVRETR